ncbi:MAG: isochorismate synthase [Opitutales bacterium]
MHIIPHSILPTRDEAALRSFLGACCAAAKEKGHYQIASITIAVEHIAPLAVLESIYNPAELHFYLERSNDEVAIAAIDAVVSAEFSGPGRYQKIKEFAATILENSIAIGDLELEFSGPHFFTALAFDQQMAANSEFAPATIFLPRWQVFRCGAQHGAVANLKIEADSDVDTLVERVWRAYDKFQHFNYSAAAPINKSVPPKRIVPSTQPSDKLAYLKAVEQALQEIQQGHYEKVVLARAHMLHVEGDWQALRLLNRLRHRFPRCFTFSFANGGGSVFLGASPERILRVKEGKLTTEAIAGSAPRGETAGEDALLGRHLLSSDKDLQEHCYVRDSIVRRLQKVGLSAHHADQPQLLALANVQHLHTPIVAEVEQATHIVDILAEMHPTPAVGGTPRDQAVPRIQALEGIQRGLYAGVVGWFNHLNEGDMVVGIRSALIRSGTAQLFAGAGIVAGSEPESEYHETELKLRAMYSVFSDDDFGGTIASNAKSVENSDCECS